MDFTSVFTIIVAAVIVYFFIKFIVSPVLRAIVGVIAFLLVIYLMQRFLGFDLKNVFGPYAVYLDIGKWIPVDHYFDQIVAFFKNAWAGVPKTFKQ